ncbi:hypothetical protein WJX72_012371 [[Myrmecia] bisecta]|uniref:RAP domain-containing protein n=1 Tax=[Myrmecia] bisecta TaxID=41462 RepID=A0AAW1PVD6_9CHLO
MLHLSSAFQYPCPSATQAAAERSTPLPLTSNRRSLPTRSIAHWGHSSWTELAGCRLCCAALAAHRPTTQLQSDASGNGSYQLQIQRNPRLSSPFSSRQGRTTRSQQVNLRGALLNAATVEELYKALQGAQKLDTVAAALAIHKLRSLAIGLTQQDLYEALCHPEFAKLEAFIVANVDKFDTRGLSTVFDGLAKLDEVQDGGNRAPTFQAVAHAMCRPQHSQKRDATLALRQVLTVLDQSSKLRTSLPNLIPTVLDAFERGLPTYSPAAISRLLHQLSEMGLQAGHPRLLRCAVHRMLEMADELSPFQMEDVIFLTGKLRGAQMEVDKDHMRMLSKGVQRSIATLNAKNLAAVIRVCAIYGFEDRALLKAVAGRCLQLAPTFKVHAISIALWGMAKLEFRLQPELLAAFMRQTEANLASAVPTDLGNLLWALKKFDAEVPAALLEGIADLLAACSPASFSGRSVASFIWVFGALGHRPRSLDYLVQVAEMRMLEFNSQDVSTILYGLASMGARPEDFLNALAARAANIINTFQPQGLANVAWSYAKLDHPATRLMHVIADEVLERLAELQTRDICDVLWAFGRSTHRGSPRTVTAIADRMEKELMHRDRMPDDWTLRDMAATVWALGCLDERRPRLLKVINGFTFPRSAVLNAIDLSNLMWGFAKLQLPLTVQAQMAYTQRVAELAGSLGPRELSTILWAFGRFETYLSYYPGVELMDKLAARIKPELEDWTPQCISSAAWAFGRMRHHPGPLLDAFKRKLLQRRDKYAAPDWSGVIWGMTRLGYHPAELYDSLALAIEEDTVVVDAQLIATVCWSLAIFGELEHSLYSTMLQYVQRMVPGDFGDARTLRNLYQAHLLACATGAAQPDALPTAFRQQGRSLWVEAMNDTSTSSDLHNDIAHTLYRIGLPATIGADINEGLFKMDIMLRHPQGNKVAIEVLGPAKLTRNTHQMTARVLYRNRSLKALGFTVLTVPWDEWNALGRDDDAQEEYLIRLLAPVLPDLRVTAS